MKTQQPHLVAGLLVGGEDLSLSKQLVCMGCGWKVERSCVDMD